jgi:hypothetical protein
MRIFFSLAPHFIKNSAYEQGVRDMARRFNLDPVFAHSAPAERADEWLAARVAESQFAFFDLTGLDAGVLFAYGIATQSDDATTLALIDPNEHAKAKVATTAFVATLIREAKQFHGADDFQRKAQLFIGERVGPSQLLDGAFIASIKDRIAKKGPIYMRQLAQDVGRPMQTVQQVVYELVRKGEVKKISDKRWTQYSA